MSELEKKIIGDWVDVRESSKHLYMVAEHFKLSKEEIVSIIRNLEIANEFGIVEYKKACLTEFFRALEDIRYKSVGLDKLSNNKDRIRHLVYVTLIQRLITSGTVSLSVKAGAEANLSADNIEITLILRDVLQRIKENPELKKNIAMKNILVQFAVYTREKETLDKLKSTAKNTSSFYKNFKETFERIYASIRKNYATILKEEASQFTRKEILSLVDLSKVSTLLHNEAKLFSRINTTIDFVQTDKFKVREILVGLLDDKKDFFSAIENEMKLYEDLGKTAETGNPSKAGISISNSFRNEVIIQLEKQLEKDFPENEDNT
jgi:hypothetical protein